MWDVFLDCARHMRSGEFSESVMLLKDICESGVSAKYRTIFSILIRDLSKHLDMGLLGLAVDGSYAISASLELELCGLTKNKVWRTLWRLMRIGLRRLHREL
jgi:hypothetical protein